MIPDQIVESVESSRRTVIVLSENYVKSVWTKMEFNVAHTQALNDSIQRLIVIKHGDLPDLGDMDDNMGEYLKMTTYLDSEDPWFWEKLRYALPHRGWRRQQRKRRNTET